MGNIIDYVKEYGIYDFAERPFNEVDALVLAQFAYFKLADAMPGLSDDLEAVSLQTMKESGVDASFFTNTLHSDYNSRLWDALVESNRFGTMKCNYIKEILSDSMQTQFCAFTVFPKDMCPVVLYRGTDETILGWKEDYNMTMDNPVPGQKLSSLYLRQVLLRFSGDIITVGHSKGGNLAIYSVIDSDENIKDRIKGIYCFDGPCFTDGAIEGLDTGILDTKLYKYIPQASIVGILLEKDHKYKVVHSTAHGGALQHDPFSWEIKNGQFVYRKTVNKKSLRLNEKIIHALDSLEDEQLQFIGKVLFDILQEDGETTTIQLSNEGLTLAKKMVRSMKDIDPQVKRQLKEILDEYN